MIETVGAWTGGLLDFIFPNQCLLCDGPLQVGEDLVCDPCWSRLPPVEDPVSAGLLCRDAMDEIRAGYYYTEDFQKIIHHLKYHRHTRLARRIGLRLYDVLRANPTWLASDVIVPVPMHKIKQRERGYNQAAEMARSLSSHCGIPCREDILVKKAHTVSQTKMSEAAGRIANMSEVLVSKSGVRLDGRQVILVDDLITTGATANACANALKKAGAASVRVLTAGRPYFGASPV